MTATRDRRSDPEEGAEPSWDERSIFGKSRGLPWWGAVLLAFGLAAIAAAFDMQRQDTLGKIYQGAYLVGCVAAICLVRRRSLFGPMVQPPLVFAVTAVAAVVLLAPDTGGGGGLKSLIFSVALPLTSNFPTMAIATGLTVAVGLFRIYRERDPEVAGRPSLRRERPGKDRGTPARGRRTEPEAAADFDADERPRRRAAPDPGASRRGDRRGGPDARRGEAPRRDSGRRGDSRRDPEDPRRGRRTDGDAGLGKSGRGPRPDADPDAEPRRGLRGRPGRDARPEQSSRDRSGTDRGRGRSRDRDAAPSRRREGDAERPRRDDRSRRDAGERGTSSRRRPQDPLR